MANNVINLQNEFNEKAEKIGQEQKENFISNLTGVSENINAILGGENAEDILGNLMALNDNDFNLISEIMLDQIERSLKDPTVPLQIAQIMNANGQKVEEVIAGLKAFIFGVDKMEEFKDLPQRKRDFIKRRGWSF